MSRAIPSEVLMALKEEYSDKALADAIDALPVSKEVKEPLRMVIDNLAEYAALCASMQKNPADRSVLALFPAEEREVNDDLGGQPHSQRSTTVGGETMMHEWQPPTVRRHCPRHAITPERGKPHDARFIVPKGVPAGSWQSG